MIFPDPVRPGDRVAVVAASSPFDADVVREGIAFLRTRYEVTHAPTLFERAGYLAGTDERRRAELQGAIADPSVRAIVAARGGYGASRFVHDLDWTPFAASPKWIAGFSDVTAIHVELARRGFASIHGPHVANVGRDGAAARLELVDALESPGAHRRFDDLEVVTAGVARGVLTGGNLSLLHASAAAGRLRFASGAIVFIEDIGEKPFRVDRMLTTLRLGGHFAEASAIVAGEFTSCEPNVDGVTIADVIRDCLGGLGIPVATGMPCGHGERNAALILGASAAIDASGVRASLRIGQTAALER